MPTRIDIQFVGKGITSLLIPATRETFYQSQLGKIEGFTVLDAFDPLDVTHMKTLTKYQGKTDADLLIEAKRLGKQRLEKIIRQLPEYRGGMRK
jgi:hypothetical protein